MSLHSCICIKNEWDIVGARQMGREIARVMGFCTVDQARIATAISELARNIFLYAEEGKIYFEIIHQHNRKGLRMIAIDTGPGIDDISKVMEDGYTTSGGLGAGLPGVKRIMDEFELISKVGKGTKVTVVKWLR